MRDVELYQQILGLEEPWSVKEVELNIDEGRVDIYVEHSAGVKWKCPQCERELACYDHSAERTWRHLDTCPLDASARPHPAGEMRGAWNGAGKSYSGISGPSAAAWSR